MECKIMSKELFIIVLFINAMIFLTVQWVNV